LWGVQIKIGDDFRRKNHWSLLTEMTPFRLVTFDMGITLILRFYGWNTPSIMKKDNPASTLPGKDFI
jgi:hypothetical protein